MSYIAIGSELVELTAKYEPAGLNLASLQFSGTEAGSVNVAQGEIVVLKRKIPSVLFAFLYIKNFRRG